MTTTRRVATRRQTCPQCMLNGHLLGHSMISARGKRAFDACAVKEAVRLFEKSPLVRTKTTQKTNWCSDQQNRAIRNSPNDQRRTGSLRASRFRGCILPAPGFVKGAKRPWTCRLRKVGEAGGGSKCKNSHGPCREFRIRVLWGLVWSFVTEVVHGIV